MSTDRLHRSVQIRSRIAGVLELVIAAWAVLRFTHARSALSTAGEAASAFTSGGAASSLAWAAFTIATPTLVGLWLILRGPTRLIDQLMLLSLALAVGQFALGVTSIGSVTSLATNVASVVLAFACWKLVRDDLALLAAAAVVTAGAVVALVEAFASEQDLGVGGWVDAAGDPLTVVAQPAPPRARLLARDEMGGWLELPPVDPQSGTVTIDLPAGRWYLALQTPTPLEAKTTLRVVREVAEADVVDEAAAPLAA
jgi:hypothetical protein